MTVVDLILRFIKRKPPITVLFSRNGAFLLTYFSGPHDVTMHKWLTIKSATVSTFRLSNQTLKMTLILTLCQANAPTLMRCNILKHIPNNIWHT